MPSSCSWTNHEPSGSKMHDTRPLGNLILDSYSQLSSLSHTIAVHVRQNLIRLLLDSPIHCIEDCCGECLTANMGIEEQKEEREVLDSIFPDEITGSLSSASGTCEQKYLTLPPNRHLGHFVPDIHNTGCTKRRQRRGHRASDSMAQRHLPRSLP